MDVRLLAAVTACSLEGVNVARLCRELGVSRKTFYKWRARFAEEGMAGLEERSSRPRTSPGRVDPDVEDEIVGWRRRLADAGLDCGPASIRYHLGAAGRDRPPSEATIWRVLVRRGLVVPQPRRRPRSAWRRFEAPAPNELWQIDATAWVLADATPVEILNIIDDHSRVAVAARAMATVTSERAWRAFWAATRDWGVPRGCLSDNGLAFSGRLRGFAVHFERRLREAGIVAITARPHHPQTCGKVERFQQTEKRWLAANGPYRSLEELQADLDRFRRHYNEVRPHRAAGRRPPIERWRATPAVVPDGRPVPAPPRRTRSVVRDNGVVIARPWRFALGVAYAGAEAEIVYDDRHAAIYVDGQLVRSAPIDPGRTYQASGKRRGGRRQPRRYQ